MAVLNYLPKLNKKGSGTSFGAHFMHKFFINVFITFFPFQDIKLCF